LQRSCAIFNEAAGNGFKIQTATDLAAQLVDERINKWKVVRRRTCQSLIGFDILQATGNI
jgi:hypothetical protein